MAKEYYWKGSDTLENNPKGMGDGFSESTYWNRASNWFVKEYVERDSSNITGSTEQEYGFTLANKIPGGVSTDIVVFTKLPADPSLGLQGGPWPKSPCLFGGMAVTGASGATATFQWINSSGDTAGRESSIERIVINRRYGCDFYDSFANELRLGWQFGNNSPSVNTSLDGVSWDGLHFSAKKVYCNLDGYGAFIKEFRGGDFYNFGSSTLSMSEGTADNFIYSQDNQYLYDDTLTEGCPKYTSSLSQVWVTCNVIDTLRIDADELYGGFFQHVTNIKTKNAVITPRRVGLDYYAIFGDFETFQVHPWLTYSAIDHPNINQYPVLKLFGNLDSSGASVDRIIMRNENKIVPEIEFIGSNNNLEFASSIEVGNLFTESGNISIGNLSSTDSVKINGGVIRYDTNLYLHGSDPDTKIELGTNGTAGTIQSLQIISDEKPDSEAFAFRTPKFYLSPGTYIRGESVSISDTIDRLNSGASFADSSALKFSSELQNNLFSP